MWSNNEALKDAHYPLKVKTKNQDQICRKIKDKYRENPKEKCITIKRKALLNAVIPFQPGSEKNKLQ